MELVLAVKRGSHLIIAARMDEVNKGVLDYFLIPKGRMPMAR
jgi:hypothetical protein